MKKEGKKSAFAKICKSLAFLLNPILLKILAILILAVALVFGGKFGWKKLGEIKTERSSAVVFRELVRCSELVTVKNTYSDIISIKKTRIAGFAKTFSIIKYTGTIRGGIADISASKITVSDRGKSVKVVLPVVEVLSNDISSIEVFDESKSIFVTISLKDVMNEIRFNQESSSAEILETGFLNEAEKQAVKVVESMLYAAGFEKVSVECKK
ncbi:DUF4230 domain-containing protein [uncultured Treponema sp.]|uniref:DUF4230 domain-containing protein n=1 Tax=uncultured Treponema sp. TaxID=162155 RepID=UPI00260131CE|nr:DUF4230 domain-containing protein [uncultured Treponema sp.]